MGILRVCWATARRTGTMHQCRVWIRRKGETVRSERGENIARPPFYGWCVNVWNTCAGTHVFSYRLCAPLPPSPLLFLSFSLRRKQLKQSQKTQAHWEAKLRAWRRGEIRHSASLTHLVVKEAGVPPELRGTMWSMAIGNQVRDVVFYTVYSCTLTAGSYCIYTDRRGNCGERLCMAVNVNGEL